MGEAKRRGTFEQRKAAAVAKAKEEEGIRIMEKAAGPPPLTPQQQANQAYLLFMMGQIFGSNLGRRW